MVRTLAVLWTGLMWLTAVQALMQITPTVEGCGDLDVGSYIDANMTIKEVSAYWIDVYYDLGDTIPMASYITYEHGPDSNRVLCPPSSPSRHGERIFYWCHVPGLQMCASYNLEYHGVPQSASNASAYCSELLGVLTAPDETIPPSNLTCNTSSHGILTLGWSNPFPEECPVAFDVSWERVVPWDADLFEINSTTTGATSLTLEQVIPGAEYTFDVTVLFQGNYSGETNSITCITPAEPSSPPSLTVADAGTSFLYLSWEAPATANGVILNYVLNWIDDGGLTHNKTIDVVNDYNLTENVFACSVYQVALAAVNAAGLGAWDTKPAKTLHEDISDITCEVGSDSWVEVSWTLASVNCGRNGTILSWQGESLWDQYDVEDDTLLGGDVASFNLTGLHPFTLYDICVSLTEDWAELICSQATTRQGVPAAPENIETSSTKSTVSLSWNEPQSWNGIPSHYFVTCPSVHITEEVDTNTTQLTIMELSKGTEYTISVQACNGEQCSRATQVVVTTDDDEGKPQDSNTGLIVGLTLGSVAVVAAIAAILVVRARRKRRTAEEDVTGITGSVSSLSTM